MASTIPSLVDPQMTFEALLEFPVPQITLYPAVPLAPQITSSPPRALPGANARVTFPFELQDCLRGQGRAGRPSCAWPATRLSLVETCLCVWTCHETTLTTAARKPRALEIGRAHV